MATLTELSMPKFGLTMTEGTIVEWFVQPGQAFARGELLVAIETDKIVNDVEAPADGVLQDYLVPVGETVAVGESIARCQFNGETPPELWSPADEAGGAAETRSPPVDVVVDPAPATAAPAQRGGGGARRSVASPLARRLAREFNIDLTTVVGSGPRGRIKAGDVRAAQQAAQPAAQGGAMPAPDFAPVPPADWRGGGCRSRRATPHEAAVARRLSESKREIPHFYLSTEVDVAELLHLREVVNADWQDLRLTINHLIVAAVSRAMALFPLANSVWRDGNIVQFDLVDIGIAVETEAGLFVPVIRDAASKGLRTLATEAAALVARARAGRLTVDDSGGGAVTVSNAGMHDVTQMISIINPGQSLILGVGSIREVFRPDANRLPALRQEVSLTLSCDHRVLDGVTALKFLNRIRSLLENPVTILAN